MTEIINYVPSDFDYTIEPLQVPSAWVGLEKLIRPILKDFDIKSDKAIEFGVDWGYSLSALAQVFKEVVGVDHFQGDKYTRHIPQYEKVSNWMAQWPNAEISVQSFQQFFADPDRIGERWNLCHIDIVHTYEATFACGKEAAKRCDCVIFHDTESFADVRRSCIDIAEQLNLDFYNYPHHYGLGILVSKEKSMAYKRKGIV
jgi:hypothetical protein